MEKEGEQLIFNSSNYFLEWTPEKHIKILPENIKIYFKQEADYLYNDLKNHKLHKVHIPAYPSNFPGHMIRSYLDQNPEWYCKLYRLYTYNDKTWRSSLRSYIRRDRSLRGLNNIRNEKDKEFKEGPFGSVPCLGKTATIYRELIYDRLTEGQDDKGFFVPPKNEVRKFFGLEVTIEDVPF